MALFNDRRSNATQIKLAEQALASHKAKLSTTANKDQVRRSIKAAQQRLTELRGQGVIKTKAQVNGHLVNDHEYTEGGAGNSARNLPSAAELHQQHEMLHRTGRADHTH